MPVQDQWTEKYLREQPFMAVGSLLRAYGQINQGKDITLEQFKKDAQELFDLSIELVDTAKQHAELENNNKGENPDIPV